MKIRNLEAQYDNLSPHFVFNVDEEWTKDKIFTKYAKLWHYARELELALQAERDRSNDRLANLRAANRALMRKDIRIKAVNMFKKAFGIF